MLTKDPKTGIMTDTGSTPVGLAPKQTSGYSQFSLNMAGLMQKLQAATETGNANLSGTKNALVNESVTTAPGFDPTIDAANNTANMNSSVNSFTPAITGASNFMQNFANNSNVAATNLQTAVNTFQPNYQWQLNQETGKFDGFNPKTGKWASQENPPVQDDPTGTTIPTGTHGTIADNHNALNIKVSDNTMKLFAALNPQLGSQATDGGNFIKFNNENDSIKAARMLLQSPLYAKDTVDQALQHWSNYDATKGTGYNASILAGTGINPNASMGSLDGVQLDAMMAAMRKAEGGPNNPKSTTLGGNLIDQYAHQVASGTAGMSYQNALEALTPSYGVTTATKLLSAIQKINPNFNINQSNAQANAQTTNTKLAGDTSALVDKTNATLDLLPDAFEKMGVPLKFGGSLIPGLAGGISDVTGTGKTNKDNYNRILSEARASANAVLSTAANLGVVTAGKTADSLLPDGMDKAGLTKAIATVKDLEEKTKKALANLANASGGSGVNNSSTDITSLRAKYKY